jgi:hypothetical protein
MIKENKKSFKCATGIILVFSLLTKLAIGQSTTLNASADQDFKSIMLEMKKNYEKMEKVHIVMNVRVFEKSSSNTPLYQDQVEVHKNNRNYLCHMNGMDMLMNEKYILITDKVTREMILSMRDVKEEKKLFKDPVSISMDSLFSLYGKTQRIGKEGQWDHFRILLKKGGIENVDLYLDPANQVFHKIEYHYNDKQLASIEFKVFDIQAQFESAVFDEQNYITITKETIQPSKNFLGYKILNVETN